MNESVLNEKDLDTILVSLQYSKKKIEETVYEDARLRISKLEQLETAMSKIRLAKKHIKRKV